MTNFSEKIKSALENASIEPYSSWNEAESRITVGCKIIPVGDSISLPGKREPFNGYIHYDHEAGAVTKIYGESMELINEMEAHLKSVGTRVDLTDRIVIEPGDEK